jgi:hypothetical protein
MIFFSVFSIAAPPLSNTHQSTLVTNTISVYQLQFLLTTFICEFASHLYSERVP